MNKKQNCFKKLVLLLTALIIVYIFLVFLLISNEKEIDILIAENEALIAENDLLSSHICLQQEPTIIIEYSDPIMENLDFVSKAMNYIEPLKQYDKLEYYNQYKNIIDDYRSYLDVPESIYDFYSEEEIELMWRCIETETYDCPFEAKVGVACVILNRIEHDKFPSDPIKVIKSPNQFAYGRTTITDTTKLALEYAFEIEDITNGSIAFRSDINPKTWNGWTYKDYTDGYHYFYGIE